MIEVENVIPWSAKERAQDQEPAIEEINVVASDLGRAARFYSRVFGLQPVRGGWGDSFAIISVTPRTRLVIHDARAAVERRARGIRRWAFVVTDLEHVRALVWELGVKVARDSGAPDHIYRWSNGRSLYVQAPDDHEIELAEIVSRSSSRRSGRRPPEGASYDIDILPADRRKIPTAPDPAMWSAARELSGSVQATLACSPESQNSGVRDLD